MAHGGLMAKLLRPSSPSPAAPAPLAGGAAGLAEGDAFAGYSIGRLLGRGSTGMVWAARDQHRGGWVALKLLALDLSSGIDDWAELRRRFLDEFEVARRLRHPDIVEVVDAGEADGRLWLAMELARGCSLERYARPALLLPEPVVLDLVARIARALAHAHASGVVHRDIKPSNVLVNLSAGSVKLIDFGTARLLDHMRTRTGVILGTPAYMAPEQLAGAGAEARSDLYSLGVLLFEMLTGHRPYESESMGELLRQVASQKVPDIRERRPDLPAALAVELSKLLAKDPGDRHADGNILADALARARMHMAGAGAAR